MSLEVLQRNLRTEELLAQTREQADQLETQAAELVGAKRKAEEANRDEVDVPRQHEPRDPHADVTPSSACRIWRSRPRSHRSSATT